MSAHISSLLYQWWAVTDWQRKQFPEGTVIGAANHLVKEAGEVLSAVQDGEPRERVGEELADVFFMLARVADKHEISPAMLSDFIAQKLAENKARQWPATPAADGTYGHLKLAA
jgi:NTP pyrophosphatase (non-canonical NTP hydrolase)